MNATQTVTTAKLNSILRRATGTKSGINTYRVYSGLTDYFTIDTTYFYEATIMAALIEAGIAFEKSGSGMIRVAK